jgi:hypothetical protein
LPGRHARALEILPVGNEIFHGKDSIIFQRFVVWAAMVKFVSTNMRRRIESYRSKAFSNP